MGFILCCFIVFLDKAGSNLSQFLKPSSATIFKMPLEWAMFLVAIVPGIEPEVQISSDRVCSKKNHCVGK